MSAEPVEPIEQRRRQRLRAALDAARGTPGEQMHVAPLQPRTYDDRSMEPLGNGGFYHRRMPGAE